MTNTGNQDSFEETLEQIEAIVAELESGSLPLDDMVSRYESGMRLIASCQEKLANAELKVTEISTATTGAAGSSDDHE